MTVDEQGEAMKLGVDVQVLAKLGCRCVLHRRGCAVRKSGVLQHRLIRGLRTSELLRVAVCITVSARSERRSPWLDMSFMLLQYFREYLC